MDDVGETVRLALRQAQERGRWPVQFPAQYLGRDKEKIITSYSTSHIVHEKYDGGHYIEFKPLRT